MAVINNLKIDEVDECLSLIPTLKQKIESNEIEKETSEQLLNDLKRYQTT